MMGERNTEKKMDDRELEREMREIVCVTEKDERERDEREREREKS